MIPFDLAVDLILLKDHDTTIEQAIRDAAMGEMDPAVAADIDIVFDIPIVLGRANGSIELQGTLKGKGPPPPHVDELGFVPERADFRFRATAAVVAGAITGVVLTQFVPGDWGDDSATWPIE